MTNSAAGGSSGHAVSGEENEAMRHNAEKFTNYIMSLTEAAKTAKEKKEKDRERQFGSIRESPPAPKEKKEEEEEERQRPQVVPTCPLHRKPSMACRRCQKHKVYLDEVKAYERYLEAKGAEAQRRAEEAAVASGTLPIVNEVNFNLSPKLCVEIKKHEYFDDLSKLDKVDILTQELVSAKAANNCLEAWTVHFVDRPCTMTPGVLVGPGWRLPTRSSSPPRPSAALPCQRSSCAS